MSPCTPPTRTRRVDPPPRPNCPAKLGGGSNPSITRSITSAIEGYSLGELEKIWKELTSSEMRLKLMNTLQRYKVGFNDVELFNLGLVFNSKTMTHDNYIEKDDRKVIEVAMKFKRQDEIRNRKKMIREKIKARKRIEEVMGKDSYKKRKLVKHLNEVAEKQKRILKEKYDRKVEHLRMKYDNDKEQEMDKVPHELDGEGVEGLSVFNKERFEEIERTEIKAVTYGDIEIDEDEEKALKLHPKMTIPKKLAEGYMNLPIDISYTKIRWEMMNEESDESTKKNSDVLENNKAEKIKERRKEEENKIIEAKTRMVYDSENKVYDERKQRVTDLKECSRIFLPKPLEVKREAQLEMRRELHSRVSEEYRKEMCDDQGRQKKILTTEEIRGLKKLEKRKQEGEIVVIMTDKSSKLCAMKRTDYLKLGEEHVGKDIEIGREELLRREKTLNQHALSWIKMWRTGAEHNHEDRIRQSKTTNSENRAELYLSYKDHKKIAGKTRPIATGCTSNTLALSNSVSGLVESLANAEKDKHEVISTEDLLHNAKKHDEKVGNMRLENKRRMLKKLRCKKHAKERTWVEETALQMLEEIIEKIEDPGQVGPLEGEVPGPVGLSLGPHLPGAQGQEEEDKTTSNEELAEKELDENLNNEKLHRDEEEIKLKLRKDCEECGPPENELELCMLGLDVEALFPSMTSKRTGEIVRKRMMKSEMKLEGFNWRMGLVYIKMNKHLTSNLGNMWKILPFRKKVGGRTPGMSSDGMTGKKGKVEDQWTFKTKTVTREQLMEIAGRCLEIAIRTVFENFIYNFGGKMYLQRSGGPIGNRLTMACSRVVMQEWGEQYLLILKEAGLSVTLFKIYVDDVRQISTVLKPGMRFDEEEKKMIWKAEYEKDDELRKEQGETDDARMSRILNPAMNSVNEDLKFTTEIREDFMDEKLPTLDCKLWFDEDWTVNHTYFEKEMRTQLVIPENSAMCMRQKMSILSNELIRRLSNINIEKAEEDEKVNVVEHYTKQLKTSGYDRNKSREIVVSGLVGWMRKRKRREQEGKGFYRGAESTLKGRIRKKLLDPVTWFKSKPEEDTEIEKEHQEKSGRERLKKRKSEEEHGGRNMRMKEEPKAVMFCPYTPGGDLAKRLRDVEENMEKNTGYRIKIVEEAGEKILDILHSSNPWKGEICGRSNCWLCETKEMTEKGKKQDCSKRSIVYETWCETCLRQEMMKIDEGENDEQEKMRKKQNIKVHKYIGETARSAYERGIEHKNALEKLDEDSHMLKHIANYHENEEIEDIRFGMRVVKYTRSALERQVLESVRIQEEREKNYIMNSRSEYNRCTIPRLTAKMGEEDYDKRRQEEKRIDRIMEEKMRMEINKRKKDKCKRRGNEMHDFQDLRENNMLKKRRINKEGDYKVVVQNNKTEKNKERYENDHENEGLENKRLREEQPRKILGGRIRGMEIEKDFDWQKHREEQLELMRKEEEQRLQRIEKARRLQRSFELMRECKKIIEENNTKWMHEDERRLEKDEQENRLVQIEKAKTRKKEFEEKQRKRETTRKITDLLEKIPEVEVNKIENEIRRKERIELAEVRKNVWKKWRGKSKILENKTKIPTEIEKLESKLEYIERKVKEYIELREKQLTKRDNKKKQWREKNKMIVEDTWGMLRWLMQYIDENKYDWEKRRETEQRKNEYREWKEMEEGEMIMKLKGMEETLKTEKETKLDKARQRKSYWKNWRKLEEVPEIENEVEKPGNKHEIADRLTLVEEMKNKRKAWKLEMSQKIKKSSLPNPKPTAEILPNQPSIKPPYIPNSTTPIKSQKILQTPSPSAAQLLKTPSNPVHSSQKVERVAKGLPPVQIVPSEVHLHEGVLGEAKFRGGVVASPNPPPPFPIPPTPENH